MTLLESTRRDIHLGMNREQTMGSQDELKYIIVT